MLPGVAEDADVAAGDEDSDVDVFDEPSCAFAHDLVSDCREDVEEVTELRAREREHGCVGPGRDGRGATPVRDQQRDLADDRTGTDGDGAVRKRDIDDAVEDDEAFLPDLTVLAQHASGGDGHGCRHAVDAAEVTRGATGEDIDVAQPADGLGQGRDEEHGGLLRPATEDREDARAG